MASDQRTVGVDDRLNELYWNSGQTIDEILERIGVGRNTLYSTIQPLEAGVSCASCDEPLYFTNRTNRAAGTATCLNCGSESKAPQPGATPTASAIPDLQHNGNGRAEGNGWTRWRDDLRVVPGDRAALIGGAAALGLMVGAAATRALRD